MIPPSGSSVSRNAEWPVVGMETEAVQASASAACLLDPSGEDALPPKPMHGHTHTQTRGQGHGHTSGALGLFAERPEASALLSLSVKWAHMLCSSQSPRNCSFTPKKKVGSQTFFVFLSLSSSLDELHFDSKTVFDFLRM